MAQGNRAKNPATDLYTGDFKTKVTVQRGS